MAIFEPNLMSSERTSTLNMPIYKADTPIKLYTVSDTSVQLYTYDKKGKQSGVIYDFKQGSEFYIIGRDQSNTNSYLVQIGNKYAFMTIPGAANGFASEYGSSANAFLVKYLDENGKGIKFDPGVNPDGTWTDYASEFNRFNDDANNSSTAEEYARAETVADERRAETDTPLPVANYSNEIVVRPGYTDADADKKTVYESIVRSHGVPPQWTKYVDPRVVTVDPQDMAFSEGEYQSANVFDDIVGHLQDALEYRNNRENGYWGLQCALGRRYVSVIISNPTVIELAPGYIKYANWLLESDIVSAAENFNNSYNPESPNADAAATLAATFNDTDGVFYTIKPCFTGDRAVGAGVTRPGYIKYVNALMRIAAIFLSRSRSTNSSATKKVYKSIGITEMIPETLGTRKVAGYGGLQYNQADWTGFNKPKGYIKLNVGGMVINAATNGSTGTTERFDYIKFYLTGSTTADDQFETGIEESMLGNIANTINSALKEAAFWTADDGPLAQVLAGIKEGAQDIFNSTKLNGINPLQGVFNISEMVGGAKIVFPKIITESSYGKSINCECSFAAIYGDEESIYLNSIMPYLHLLAFVLPHQVKTSLEMYTYPFIVKAYCRGLFNVEMGVITNFNVSRGGSDNALWSFNGTAELISCSFTVTPLITNLVMTPEDYGLAWIMKNKGLQEYISAITAFDARNDKYDLALDIAASWMTSSVVAKFRNVFENITTSELVTDVVQFIDVVGNGGGIGNMARDTVDTFLPAINNMGDMLSF